jgi:hypothetical protein
MIFTVRNSHIKRIYKDDDKDSDVWVDIERVDDFTVDTVHIDNAGGQKVSYSFEWHIFDPNDENNDVLTIENPDDADTSIKIPLRNFVDVQYNDYLFHINFDNTENNGVRKTHTKKVYNHDIPEENLDNDRQPPREADTYKNVIKGIDKDESQYIEIEIIDKYVLNHNQGPNYSKKKWTQNIDAILSQSL